MAGRYFSIGLTGRPMSPGSDSPYQYGFSQYKPEYDPTAYGGARPDQRYYSLGTGQAMPGGGGAGIGYQQAAPAPIQQNYAQAAPVAAAPGRYTNVGGPGQGMPQGGVGGGYAFNSLADAQQHIGPLLASGALGQSPAAAAGNVAGQSYGSLADVQRAFPGFSLPPMPGTR